MTFDTRMERMDGLLSRILPQVLPCPRSMALDAVQMVAGDFCKETGAWSMVLTENVFAGECRIAVAMPRDAVLVDVLGLYLDGRRLDRPDYIPSPYDIVLRFTPQSDAVATIEATARRPERPQRSRRKSWKRGEMSSFTGRWPDSRP